MDCYGNILHEKGLSNSTQFLMEGISCVTPRKRLYLTNRFQVAVLLFSNRSQMTSKYSKAECATFLFLPHFDVLCDLLLNRRTATWDLFVLYNKELKYTEKKSFNDDVIYTSVLQ